MAGRRGVVAHGRRWWRHHEPEFVDNVRGEQCLRDRDTCVDADIPSAPLLEIPDECDELAIEHRRIGPIAAGLSATPSRDNNSYTTSFRTPYHLRCLDATTAVD